jgi:hypothetical protein
LSLFSKGLLFAPKVAVANSRGIRLAGAGQQQLEQYVAFGRAIAASSYGEVLHFNLGMEDQWG